MRPLWRIPGEVCRPAAGDCDLAEQCDGSLSCPADLKSTAECRLSSDGGATWHAVTTTPAYQGVVNGAYGSCTPVPEISGQQGWSGDISPSQWTQVRVVLDEQYKCSQFRFRFLFGADQSSTDWGWLIDDVQLVSGY